jgi:hypothetical protein
MRPPLGGDQSPVPTAIGWCSAVGVRSARAISRRPTRICGDSSSARARSTSEHRTSGKAAAGARARSCTALSYPPRGKRQFDDPHAGDCHEG